MRTKVHLKVRRDDLVEVIAGDDKGRRGKVLRVHPEAGQLVVEGINTVWKHLRRSQENPQGGRIEREAPLDISNVQVVSEETGTAQRVRMVAFATAVSGKSRSRVLRYRVGARDGKPMTAADKELAAKHQAEKG